MQTATAKSISIAREIQSELIYDYTERLAEVDLLTVFKPVYDLPGETMKNKNIVICFIIYAYNPESLWLDIKKDRIDNKKRILYNLDAELDHEFIKSVIDNSNENVNMAVFNFLEIIKDWRWRSVFDLIEYAAKMSRFSSLDTADEKKFQKATKDGEVQDYSEEVPIETIVKVNKEKGNLINLSLDARKKADDLIEQIQKEYVATDNATQQDFDFAFTQTAKKRDPLSWRQYIRERDFRLQQ